MSESISSIKRSNGSNFNIRLPILFPDECPTCHSNIHPKQWGDGLVLDNGFLEVPFICTNSKCKHLFIGYYQAGFMQYELVKAGPCSPKCHVFSNEIKSISPSFIEIYNEAICAESYGLHKLFGTGLRKALEFLVKDFCTFKHPEEEEKIRNAKLGQCIDNYIVDGNIKEAAKRTNWLGTDESHYVKKWIDKDISDLKALLDITVLTIESHLKLENYKNNMNKTMISN